MGLIITINCAITYKPKNVFCVWVYMFEQDGGRGKNRMKFSVHPWDWEKKQVIYVCDLQHVLHTTRYIFFNLCKTFGKMSHPMSKLNSPVAEMTSFLRVHYLATNSPHYSWPYSRGHCHGVYFFFTPLNWKSRENESRHPHMEWAIGLTLTCPQTAKWKNSFIYVMLTVGDCAGGQYRCWCQEGILVEI